ncbi:uncharacterized protein LOC121863620 [Homarus americanus]|uniref:Mitochondrial cardiolipin hydrolase n=1 Tax=Homarus americanus TaxID=6706 RepID=A0A8J5N168_HOMAM|nr:uncharacterized protein LOC121863620 [Homarus americanus]KAG7171127.1 Mitochondrial cardiolipin hydrolase-like [Homarus americanus]
MSSFKYPVLGLSIVVGSELIFRWLKHIYNYAIDLKNCKKIVDGNLYMMTGNTKPFSRVIFFPDKGIVSSTTFDGQYNNKDGYKNLEGDDVQTGNITGQQKGAVSLHNDQLRNFRSSDYDPVVRIRATARLDNQELFKQSTRLRRSTSLIYMINVLDSAKRSLEVCLYILTCKDLVSAIVRAKLRGVRVRVLLGGTMEEYSTSSASILLKHNIMFRFSNPALLMHHKFAIVDAPEHLQKPHYDGKFVQVDRIYSKQHEVQGKDWINHKSDTKSTVHSRVSDLWKRIEISRFFYEFSNFIKSMISVPKNDHHNENFEGVLMTGSFNWTWAAVTNNYENVVITNDPQLVNRFAEEFHSLWKNLET